MISRSSIKNLSNTVVYMMSKKKITEQYRKPIEQLKKEHQQNQPKPDIDKAFKAGRQFIENQTKKSQQYQTRQMFKKNNQQNDNTKDQNKKVSQNTIDRNWLEMQQFSDTTQLAQIINSALNNLQNKNHKEIKNIVSKIKSKYGIQGYQFLLNSLFKKDFQKTFSLLMEQQKQITKLSSKILTTIFLNLAQNEELEKLQKLFKQLEQAKTLLQYKHQQFFEILFFKQINQDIKYLTGQNGVNLSFDNKILKEKIILSKKYLQILSQNGKKKKSLKKSITIPKWFDKVQKIILKHKFAVNEFRTLLNQILTNNEFILPQWFYQTESFTIILRNLYFGEQSNLQLILNLFEKNHRNIKFSTFYKNLTNQLMNYRIQNNKPAFYVDQILIQNYKKGFQTKNKFLSILCSTIAADAKYIDFAQHYSKFYMQGFPNQSLASEYLKYVQEGILNNYNRIQHAQMHQKNITRLSKGSNSTFTKIKALIKLGQLTTAWKTLENDLFKRVAIERQRKNIQFVLRNRLGEKSANYHNIKQINQFIQTLSDQYLWSLYKNSQDLSIMLKNYLPEDKFSFWQQYEKKNRFDEISTKYHNGELKKIKQPVTDIQADGFSIEQYLQKQYPQLLKLEEAEYQKKKQLIRFTLRVEGLQLLYKVQSDAIIIQRLKQYQEGLSQQTLQILQNFGLKDYDIAQFGWTHFQKRLQNMRIYNFIAKDDKLNFSRFQKFLEKNKSLTKKSIIQQMIYKCPENFRQAQQLVKLNQEPIVQLLLLWGVYSNQPMAIYLGQKLAMQTGQIISHNVALKVSKMLSYKKILSQQFINKCKQCLKIVGRIDRQFIYSFDKEYQHILLRNNYLNYVQKYFQDRKLENQLQDLTSYTPRLQLLEKQSKFYQDSIKYRANLAL